MGAFGGKQKTPTADMSVPAAQGIDVKARAKAAILGALVADAATLPLHWIYDTGKIDGLVDQKSPAFFSPPSCPFYQGVFGEQSPYGDELHAILQVAAATGDIQPNTYSEMLYEHYQQFQGYKNHSVKTFIANYEAGSRGTDCGDAEDFQANCFVKAPVIVAKFGGTDQLATHAAATLRVQQNNAAAEQYGVAGALILDQVVQGSSIAVALDKVLQLPSVADDVKAAIKKGLANKDKPFREAVKEAGLSCANPGALTNVVTAVVKFPDYATAVKENILAGGDNCSRSCLLGALFAAQGGSEVIPEEWRSQTSHFQEYERLINQLQNPSRTEEL